MSGSATRTLVLHWNGRTWTRLSSPSAGTGAVLQGVAAPSATTAWAVGASVRAKVPQSLILHWNGRRWAREASPQPSRDGSVLNGIGAASARDTWAVGEFISPAGPATFAIHCC
jgi:hypothetical protein